ncbi:hypothetical protein [Mesorhizobium sp. M2A.F.Ca.ET.039.01.1.1]|uniref:hypothetical protein n=1 Tax=Mesorhizobium sp. M2A.F.Ca.ET.039.01.1.1 TaxID=2496746 RepID=UPI000FC9A3A0|nr:hypothetical protein [Mesorhizobium sp. M2A.F.Ca.ET.039.01.1.1]RWX72532.1 hypothetical protein EOA24_00635 [Mesorhizobium sp. M2A.F.Ca.ET.039.01.1.1]
MNTRYKTGDIVSVKATVRYPSKGGVGSVVSVEIEGHYGSVNVDPEVVTMLRPNFEIGEVVEYTPDETHTFGASILGMAGDEVWIEISRAEEPRRVVAPLSKVRREPETPAVAEDAQ